MIRPEGGWDKFWAITLVKDHLEGDFLFVNRMLMFAIPCIFDFDFCSIKKMWLC